MDWYDITFKDSTQSEYRYKNKWKSTQKVIEEIKIKGQPAFYDTVTYTHHGPVVWDHLNQTPALGKSLAHHSVRQTAEGRALRWLAHDASNELRSLYLVNRAENYFQFVDALETYTCPGQNFVYADVNGNIAIWHSGNQPAKWDGQGMLIMDGNDPTHDWQAIIPHEQKPHILNPKRGYVSSANQHVTDGDYPYFLSSFFWMSYRGAQINRQLDKLKSANVDDMKQLQFDITNGKARNVLPVLLNILHAEKLSDDANLWLSTMKAWDYQNSKLSKEASFFDTWQKHLEYETWADEFGHGDDQYLWPYFNQLDEMIRFQPASKWFDNTTTAKKETLVDICYNAFNQTVAEINKLDSTQMEWQNFQGTDILHIAKIPGMGRINLQTSGGADIINATRLREGPSWRLVIEMDDNLQPFGIYPGGQSGYPGSVHYDDYINDWVDEKFYELPFGNTVNDIEGSHLLCK
jgi:penicillin amidase